MGLNAGTWRTRWRTEDHHPSRARVAHQIGLGKVSDGVSELSRKAMMAGDRHPTHRRRIGSGRISLRCSATSGDTQVGGAPTRAAASHLRRDDRTKLSVILLTLQHRAAPPSPGTGPRRPRWDGRNRSAPSMRSASQHRNATVRMGHWRGCRHKTLPQRLMFLLCSELGQGIKGATEP